MSDLRAILTPANMLLSVVMYYPLFRRILLRRSTADFSKSTQVTIVMLQVSSTVVAVYEGAWFLFSYYLLQIVLTSATLWLVYHYSKGKG